MKDGLNYETIIRSYAEEHRNQRFPNGKSEHAIIVLTNLFRYSDHEIRIFNKCLADSVYGQDALIDAAQRFIEKQGSRLTILLQNSVSLEENRFLSALYKVIKDRTDNNEPHGEIDIRIANGAYAESDAKHFTVTDRDGFRFERDHEKKVAVSNFNEPETARRLREAFDRAYEDGLPQAS